LFYSAPLLFSYFVNKIIFSLKYIQSDEAIDAAGNTSSVTSNLIGEFSSFIFSSNITHIFIATFGLLFAPGVGLFIFSPILITVFFSFPDLYRKNKSECLLFLSFFISTLFYHADLQHWHGLVAWGTRYLIPLIPFLIIPLGTSLEKRNKKFMFLIIFIFGSLGVLFNFAYVVQDVSWFVWSTPGSTVGLFALGLPHIGQFDLWINDVVIWTFQYSQLTHSILLMVEGLQHDIYLLHLLGIPVYISVLTLFLSSLFYFLRYILKQKTILNKNFENIT
jgi:hypothetical protein